MHYICTRANWTENKIDKKNESSASTSADTHMIKKKPFHPPQDEMHALEVRQWETANKTRLNCTESAIVVVTTGATRVAKGKRGMQCSCPLFNKKKTNKRETKTEGTAQGKTKEKSKTTNNTNTQTKTRQREGKRQEKSKTKNKAKQEQGGRVALKLNSCMHTRVMVSATAHMQAKARKTFTDQKINITKPHVQATLRHLLNRSR